MKQKSQIDLIQAPPLHGQEKPGESMHADAFVDIHSLICAITPQILIPHPAL
jgi:hypothetical protein